MKSNRPYLIRALYEWILDNDCTPHVIVDAEAPGVSVPMSYVKDGQIVLNLAPKAVSALTLGNDQIFFSARFGGKPTEVLVPIAAVRGIYARENGQGLVFPAELSEDASGTDSPEPGPGNGTGGPRLRVVK
ncbi:MAG: ClpXP protease specificity-enhancing factor [Porticoccaceae bacterium]|jgi:stringent starvation protein B|nr:MAG: ClpXP protease specificity-enhancing factor [Porticoccaceae bacterium]